MRYFRQPDQYSCGPTAIANALVWGGVEVKLRQMMPLLSFSCQTRDLEFPDDWEANGTLDSNFDRTLRYASKGLFTVRRTSNATANQIKKHLLNGGAIALGYFWKEGSESGEHFVFIPEFKRDHFIFVNDHNCRKGRVSRQRSIEKMKEYLRVCGPNNQRPVVWFLTLKAAKTE